MVFSPPSHHPSQIYTHLHVVDAALERPDLAAVVGDRRSAHHVRVAHLAVRHRPREVEGRRVVRGHADLEPAALEARARVVERHLERLSGGDGE